MKMMAVPSAFRRRRTVHQLGDLLRGEHRRRLVEHEDSRVAVQGAEDLDALLHADADVLDAGIRIDRQPVAVGELLDALARRAAVEDADRARGSGLHRLVAEHDVLGDGHHRDEHEVLVHHADPQVDRVVRGVDADRLAVDQDLPGRRAVEPVQD